MGNEYCNQIIFSLNTTTLHYIIPYAIGASARLGPNLFLHFYTQDQWHCTIVCWKITILWILLCSTRILNELGAANPKAAQGIVRCCHSWNCRWGYCQQLFNEIVFFNNSVDIGNSCHFKILKIIIKKIIEKRIF